MKKQRSEKTVISEVTLHKDGNGYRVYVREKDLTKPDVELRGCEYIFNSKIVSTHVFRDVDSLIEKLQ